jgi:replicative DNA helicase
MAAVSGGDEGGAGIGRVPPHNLDAEEGLLACCVLDGGSDVLTACLEARMRPEAFHTPANQIMFQVLIDLYREGSVLDELIVTDRLRSRTADSIDWLRTRQRPGGATSLLDLVGGAGTIARITARIETTAHARHWLAIVKEKWMLRRLITAATHIAEQAYTNQDQLDHFLDQVEQSILSINEDMVEDSAEKFEVPVEASIQMINQMLKGEAAHGILSGYTDLDKLTFGFHSGQMIVLAARPSLGKTSLGMNIAENIALPPQGKEAVGVLIFSLEMPAEQLAMRMLCGRARVNLRKVRDRVLSREETKDLVRIGAELKQAPIWVDDSSSLNILELRAKARRIARRERIRLIIVDYLQLISGLDSRAPREQQIAEISRGLKALAKELDLPVLVLSQLNRSSEKENRLPRISDLRESGAIEQDADLVFLLATVKDSEDNPIVPQSSRERLLLIAKNRNGPTGDARLTFLADYTRFENYIATPGSQQAAS